MHSNISNIIRLGLNFCSEKVTELMNSQNVSPDIYTYNALLRAYSFSTVGDVATKEKIKIIDKIFDTPGIDPDKYTIENSLLPLSREGRVGDILKLLKDFNTKSDYRTVSSDYAAFLHALVKVRMLLNCSLIFGTY